MRTYRILRQTRDEELFVVARRVITRAGHADIRDWVKQPVNEYGHTIASAPSFALGCSDISTARRVESYLLVTHPESYTVFKEVQL